MKPFAWSEGMTHMVAGPLVEYADAWRRSQVRHAPVVSPWVVDTEGMRHRVDIEREDDDGEADYIGYRVSAKGETIIVTIAREDAPRQIGGDA